MSSRIEEMEKQLEAERRAERDRRFKEEQARKDKERLEQIKTDHDLIFPVADRLFTELTQAAPEFIKVTMTDYDFTGQNYHQSSRFTISLSGVGFYFRAVFEVEPHKSGDRYSRLRRNTGKVNVRVEGNGLDTRVWNPKEWGSAQYKRAINHVIPVAERMHKSKMYETESIRIERLTLSQFKDMWIDTGEEWSESRNYDNYRQDIHTETVKVPGPERKDGNDPQVVWKRDSLQAKPHQGHIQVKLTFVIDPRNPDDVERFKTLVQNTKAGRVGREDRIDKDGFEIGEHDHKW